MVFFTSRSISRRGFLTLLAGTPLAAYLSAPQRYTFTLIAGSNGMVRHFDRGLALNNLGMVVFSATLQTGEAGVFTGNGGPLSQIASSRERFTSFGGPYGSYAPTLNDAGTIVVYGDLQTGGTALYLSRGGQLMPIADTTHTFAYLGQAFINNRGTVVFSARRGARAEGLTAPELVD